MISQFSRTGIQVVRNDQAQPTRDVDLVFRWGCTSDIPSHAGVVNQARAIHLVSDKPGFRRAIGDLGPPAWQREEEVTYPAVFRPVTHHQGRHLYVANNPREAADAIRRCRDKAGAWYASPLINKTSEYRVFVVSGRVICVAEKTNPGNGQVAWNVAQGGHFTNVRWSDWPLKAVKNSIAAWERSGLDFGGVDIMVDGEGRTYVLEMNSAPSLTVEYRQQCMAKALDYIVEHGRTRIPLIEERGGWRKFVHPAISAEAIVP